MPTSIAGGTMATTTERTMYSFDTRVPIAGDALPLPPTCPPHVRTELERDVWVCVRCGDRQTVPTELDAARRNLTRPNKQKGKVNVASGLIGVSRRSNGLWYAWYYDGKKYVHSKDRPDKWEVARWRNEQIAALGLDLARNEIPPEAGSEPEEAEE